MKKTLNFVLLVVLISFTSCSSDENEGNIPKLVLKANIDGQAIDFVNNSNLSPHINATLIDGKRLVINGIILDNASSLTITIGETFLNNPIVEGNYKIGNTQDNLENNIQYFDPNDTSTETQSPNTEYYTGVYGCNVLNNNQVGEINITELDTVNKVVSGTFTGTLFRWIDITSGESKSIELTNGVFTLPYTEENEVINPDRDLISARVNGFRLMNNDPGSPDSRRSLATGVDKIKIIGYDKNFGRIQISILSNVVSGNNYSYQPDGSFQSLGVSFQNRINIPEGLLSNNPNQSNDSYISVINHNPETNIIEGTFYIENSEIGGRTITDGYFKVKYIDDVN